MHNEDALITLPEGAVVKYLMSMSACVFVFVCLSVCTIFTKLFLRAAYGRGSVLLWQGD